MPTVAKRCGPVTGDAETCIDIGACFRVQTAYLFLVLIQPVPVTGPFWVLVRIFNHEVPRMDFLNKSLSQLSELFRSMTPGTRITAGLLLVVVVVSLGYLFTYQVSGSNVDLMNGVPVPPGNLPAMETAFFKAGLRSPEIRGTQILVPRGQKAAYMAALADAKALPPNFGKALDEALEDTRPWIGKYERDQRLKIAKQKELALIISSMRGIERASVLYDAALKPGFKREKEVTATASVKPYGNEQLDESQVSSIRDLVAGTIAGLKPANVTVVDLNGGTYHGTHGEGGSILDDPYALRKKRYEQQWEAKILNALAYVKGVKVTANVVLDREKTHRSELVEVNPKPATLRSKQTSRSSPQDGSEPAGRPGIARGMAPASLSTSGGRDPEEQEQQADSDLFNTPATQRVVKESVGLTPQRVSISVAIPSSYFEKVCREKNPPEAGQQPQTPDRTALEEIRREVSTEIRQYVAALLPPAQGVTDPADLVTVTTFQDITPETIPEPGAGENAVTWLGKHWGTLGMIGLAVFSLLMLRSMVRAISSGSNPNTAPGTISMENNESDRAGAEAEAHRMQRFTGSGPSLADELCELVREDPDGAASVLKTWIRKAS